MKHMNKLLGLVVLSCAAVAYGQLDPGDCALGGSTLQFCAEAGAACTASDGKSGTCVPQRQGCQCAPHNLCHLDRTTGTYSALRVAEKAVAPHLRHRDCLIDDGVECTIDRCDPVLGCVHRSDDSRCDDGVFCTTETCTDEGCIAVSTCPPAIHGCVFVNDSCDEDNDVCVDRPDDSQCDDEDLCTVDSCDADTGECVNNPVSCDDSNECTSDFCNRGDGSCRHQPIGCFDSNVCTDDTCDPVLGCTYPPVDCDDGNACNGAEGCYPQLGGCVALAPLICFDYNFCTADSCDPATGCAYTPISCDDGNPCTVDTCEPSLGCQHVPVACDDGDWCNGLEACNPATGACYIASFPFCDDLNRCTADSCDPASGCVFSPVSCDDGNACTTDSCNAILGCRHEDTTVCDDECRGEECDPASGVCGPVLENGTPCDDGDVCTFGDACHEAICVGTPCSDTQTCCSGAGCVDLSTSNAHCGACGNACQDSVCFQGSCYNGCVIGGVAYPNGTRNPANNCQACNTSASRTSWVNLGTNFNNPFEYTCQVGCFTGFCVAGACGSLGGAGGCQSTTCAASTCGANGQCEFTPQNEGAACTPSLSTSVCRSGSTGICHSGQCVGAAINQGQPCIVEPNTANPNDCYSDVSGICNSTGGCVPNRLPEGSSCPGPNLCQPGTCKTVLGTFDCWTTPTDCTVRDACGGDGACDLSTGQCMYPGPLPDSGEVNCGGYVQGYRPDLCCPGQVCICNPFNSQWCIIYECWWEDDIPDDPFP